MRDWKNIDRYLNKLAADIYPQPEDSGHTAFSNSVIDTWMSRMTSCASVLDLGCGTGFSQPIFEKWNVEYEGICLGEDYMVAKQNGRNVHKMDFHFLDYPDSSFDLLFSRHSLEHSPMPLLALMEWARVSKSWLGIVLPAPEWYGFGGRNHYSVMNKDQIENLLANSGWKTIWYEVNTLERDGSNIPHEYWIMCEKA
jgi:SAM-dependent methyltransferase